MAKEMSVTPAAIRARERRFNAWLAGEERKFHAEVKVFMDRGLAFDDAWVAAGGMIVPLPQKGPMP
jgi:hypothetical protein